MNGGKNRQPLGYTIFEVMIVLVISGVMFLIAASFINGKQQRTAFTASINQMASQIQGVIEQITDGSYSDIPLSCSFSSGVTDPNLPPSGASQGANSECVFLGKLLRFAPGSSDYKLFSLAGGRASGVTNPTLGPGPSTVDPAIINALTEPQTVPQNLDVTGISVTDAGGATHNNVYYNFGFVQSLGTSSGGSFQAGGQTISMVYSPVTAIQPDPAINGNLAYAQSMSLCLSDRTPVTPTTQVARLVLGGANGSQLNVEVQRLDLGAVCP